MGGPPSSIPMQNQQSLAVLKLLVVPSQHLHFSGDANPGPGGMGCPSGICEHGMWLYMFIWHFFVGVGISCMPCRRLTEGELSGLGPGAVGYSTLGECEPVCACAGCVGAGGVCGGSTAMDEASALFRCADDASFAEMFGYSSGECLGAFWVVEPLHEDGGWWEYRICWRDPL